MLTYTDNNAPGISLCLCSYHGSEKQNSESFFNYDANSTSVITMELIFIFFPLRCWFLCMTSLVVTSSMLKTSVKCSCTPNVEVPCTLHNIVSHFHALIKHKLVYFLVWFLLGIYFLILRWSLIGWISLFMNVDWLIQRKVAQSRLDIYVSSWTNFSTYQSTRGQDFPAVFMNI